MTAPRPGRPARQRYLSAGDPAGMRGRGSTPQLGIAARSARIRRARGSRFSPLATRPRGLGRTLAGDFPPGRLSRRLFCGSLDSCRGLLRGGGWLRPAFCDPFCPLTTCSPTEDPIPSFRELLGRTRVHGVAGHQLISPSKWSSFVGTGRLRVLVTRAPSGAGLRGAAPETSARAVHRPSARIGASRHRRQVRH